MSIKPQVRLIKTHPGMPDKWAIRYEGKMDGKELNEKMKYALELIEAAQKEADGSANELYMALAVMQFGNLTIEDMMKYLEAQGYGRG